AVRRAKDKIQDIKREARKDLVIESFETPDPQYKGKKVSEFADQWAVANFKEHRVDGIYVLICKKPTILRIALGHTTQDTGVFTARQRDELKDVMLAKLKESHAAEEKGDQKKAQQLRDDALLAGVDFVSTHIRPRAAGNNPPPQGGKRAGG